MTDRIDHAGFARRLLNNSQGERIEQANVFVAAAQVHATLALVEQQRIANLIALAGLPKVDGFENEVYDARTEALLGGLLDVEEVAAVPGYGPAGIDSRVFIRPEIREGLGL